MPALPQGPYAPHVLWDNSNSQYGLLGVWAGAEVGVEVPSAYWHDVEKHWNSCQLASGEWPYWESDLKPTYSMTCAGIASLLVTHDYLDAPLLGKKLTTQPYSSALQKGISWLEEGDHAVNLQAGLWFEGYSLYGMERVGLASGFKYFGDHNWFVELAAPQLPKQMANGSFGSNDDPVSTAYMLLFLSRGRHPILANKLRFDGNWTNRPRDLANLASYVSREMERPTNWQVVDAKRDADDWADAPILYIASQKALKFDDDVIPKLTKFINNGGLIFSHADAGSAELTQSVVELTKKMFPSQVLRDLPADHALYTLNYKITSPRPKLMGVSNGCRLVWVHSPNDLSDAWQMRSTLSRKEAFQMGTNLYLYATGKEKFRNRLDTPIIPQPELAPNRTVGMARLTHSGNWNPEPGAWQRFSRKLQWDTGVKLDLEEMPITGLTIQQCRIAHLTGTEALKLTDPELAALKNFVTAGGTLLIDAAGGASAFTDAATAWLPGLLGDAKLNALEPNDPLLKKSIEGTVDAPEKRLRLYAFEQLRTDAPRIKSAKVGNGRVIFSGVDIATGLLATNTWGIVGYLPEFSEAFAKNLVLTSSR
jgi:hypothetical protein